jgi:hypothetical protein
MFRLACICFVCACATSAAAQMPAGSYPPKPAGVGAPTPEGGTEPPPNVPPPARAPRLPPETLLMNLSVFGGGGDDVNGGTVSGFPTGPRLDGDAGLAYERRAGHLTFGARGHSVIRYDKVDTLRALGQQGEVDLAFANAAQTFHASQGIGYAPYYDFGGLLDTGASPIGEAAASHGDFANRQLSAITAATGIDWTRTLTRRYALTAAYSLRRTTFTASPELDMKWQSIGGRLTRRFTRFVSLRTGYTYRIADPAFAQTTNPRNHELDLGVDYSRPVTISKRTTFSFGTGSALTPQNQRLVFNVTGDAALNRQIGRTWNARLGAKRSVQLLEGFTQPVLANAVNASVGGAFGRRVAMSSSVGFSSGAVGLEVGEANPYTNFSAGLGLSVAVGRRAAVEAQYFYTGYHYSGDLALAPGLTSAEQQRQGVRIGLTWRGLLIGH